MLSNTLLIAFSVALFFRSFEAAIRSINIISDEYFVTNFASYAEGIVPILVTNNIALDTNSGIRSYFDQCADVSTMLIVIISRGSNNANLNHHLEAKQRYPSVFVMRDGQLVDVRAEFKTQSLNKLVSEAKKDAPNYRTGRPLREEIQYLLDNPGVKRQPKGRKRKGGESSTSQQEDPQAGNQVTNVQAVGGITNRSLSHINLNDTPVVLDLNEPVAECDMGWGVPAAPATGNIDANKKQRQPGVGGSGVTDSMRNLLRDTYGSGSGRSSKSPSPPSRQPKYY